MSGSWLFLACLSFGFPQVAEQLDNFRMRSPSLADDEAPRFFDVCARGRVRKSSLPGIRIDGRHDGLLQIAETQSRRLVLGRGLIRGRLVVSLDAALIQIAHRIRAGDQLLL